MDIKILTSITSIPNSKRDCFVVGTHNGIFHSDEVVAVAILCLLHNNEKIAVVRSRDSEILHKCDICVDIGGGKYDHHQPGFNLKRDDGITYASAGLIWKHFGNQVVLKLLEEANLLEDLAKSCSNVVDTIDKNVIKFVDAEDNGIDLGLHYMSFISSYLPEWYESEPKFESQFAKVLDTTITVLEQKIRQVIVEVYATKIIRERTNSSIYFSNHILEIPSQTIPWLETVCQINHEHACDTINFVIFPCPAGGWAAQCVPPSLKKKFNQRIPFPKEWAGQTTNLSELSGVDGAILCHNGLFFARAQSKEAVLQMCKISMSLKFRIKNFFYIFTKLSILIKNLV